MRLAGWVTLSCVVLAAVVAVMRDIDAIAPPRTSSATAAAVDLRREGSSSSRDGREQREEVPAPAEEAPARVPASRPVGGQWLPAVSCVDEVPCVHWMAPRLSFLVNNLEGVVPANRVDIRNPAKSAYRAERPHTTIPTGMVKPGRPYPPRPEAVAAEEPASACNQKGRLRAGRVKSRRRGTAPVGGTVLNVRVRCDMTVATHHHRAL